MILFSCNICENYFNNAKNFYQRKIIPSYTMIHIDIYIVFIIAADYLTICREVI